ncbi:MAG: ADP-ribosylglycohydrolase family protein [Anaerolineae bacterium]|nr:ADP-ribosylglycohydrolase family protein [Anaerolineae bacterium]
MQTAGGSNNMQHRFYGCLLGLACGDALGTTVEFKPRGTFAPLTDLVGGGPFNLKAGEWTDDTSMALCLATSLLESNGFNPRDQIERYCRWWREGYLSSNGICFDIGNTVSQALRHYRATNNAYSGSTDPHTAGNGSIMRLAPVPMYFVEDLSSVIHFSGESSRTTHGAPEAVDACRLFGLMIALALRGESKESILFDHQFSTLTDLKLAPAIHPIAQGSYRTKQAADIRGSGYVVASLEAALWCFLNSTNYREAVLLAANLGDDADTTAAVCGQIAGAFYGLAGIPPEWLAKLAMRTDIENLAGQLYQKRYQSG